MPGCWRRRSGPPPTRTSRRGFRPGARRCRRRSPSGPRMAEPLSPLPPGAVIGILGGGQLGRMLAAAAARLGLRTHVYDPAPDPPAGDLAHRVTRAAFDDAKALDAFAGDVAV